MELSQKEKKSGAKKNDGVQKEESNFSEKVVGNGRRNILSCSRPSVCPVERKENKDHQWQKPAHTSNAQHWITHHTTELITI